MLIPDGFRSTSSRFPNDFEESNDCELKDAVALKVRSVYVSNQSQSFAAVLEHVP
jgi:hypothetical protein